LKVSDAMHQESHLYRGWRVRSALEVALPSTALSSAYLADAVLAGKAAGQAYNFGTDHPVAVLPLVRQILAASGRPDLEPDVQGTASAEIDRQYLDSSRARRELGWQPTVALDEGLRRAVAWYREFAPPIFL